MNCKIENIQAKVKYFLQFQSKVKFCITIGAAFEYQCI